VARKLTVVTPENIPLEMELAGLGTRFGALLIDLCALILLLIIGSIAIPLLVPDPSLNRAFVALYAFLVWFGYFILFESLWNGQTPGKRAFHLRVMRDGGYPVNFFAVAARNLTRIADFMPLFYLALSAARRSGRRNHRRQGGGHSRAGGGAGERVPRPARRAGPARRPQPV
jgi:uncharacterized RDD family membrane protein YckC